MDSPWRAYIPYHVARDLVLNPQANPVGREQRFEAVALFVDVAGFTAISEALGAMGRSGAEELTRILNSFFEPVIDLIYSYGGIIGKFGGDAVTVIFPYTAETQQVVARRAIQCALELQELTQRYAALETRVGTFSLSMKAGLAAGPIFCTTVGDPAIRLEYIIAGSVLDVAAEAEHHAGHGEVVVHTGLLALTADSEVTTGSNGFSVVSHIQQPPSHAPLPPLQEFPATSVASMAAYIHPAIAERLSHGQSSFINEHRNVTVLFVNFRGFDYDGDPEVGARLQTYLTSVIRIVHNYGGYLNKVDMGDKGSKYIVLFGAPVAHEDDCERALRCALELRALPDSSVSVGINTGFVYCGQVGSALRQEYTVMGDAVNLAARLMQAAEPGQILVSHATYRGANRSFVWQERPALRVKGKSSAVRIYMLGGLESSQALHEPKYSLPMVGRAAELAEIQQRLNQMQAGQGQIVGITAEAGMGKSRLTAEVLRLASERGLTTYSGECLSHGVNTSYLVWRSILHGLFGLDVSAPLEFQLRQLETQLAAVDPTFPQRMPLLGLALNLPIAENELTSSMDARMRKLSLEGLLVQCLRQRARQQPLLLVLEDCHWIDPLSHDLLETVGRRITDLPLLLLVVYRPPASEREQLRVARLPHCTEIHLTEFTRVEAEQLIRLKLDQLFARQGQAPAGLVERITARAEGNPFFIDEMINLIHDRGIDPDDVQALRSFDLPDSLHGLILSRIDRLSEAPKTTLKVASVIGRVFKASWLWGVYPQLGVPAQVIEQLGMLSQLDLTPLDKPEPELEYIFKHIVTREVAYETLSVATRSMLHERVGEFVEQQYAGELERYVDLLAYHYGLSRNTDKQRVYFRLAADAARAAYANETAVDYYRRLLPLLHRREKPGVMLSVGLVWELMGKWDEAEAIYREALRLAEQEHDRRLQGECQQALGALLRQQGLYADALVWLQRAHALFEALAYREGVSDTLREIGLVHWNQVQYDQALEAMERALQIASQIADRQRINRATGNKGVVQIDQQNYDAALVCFQQCLQLAEELGDRQSQGKAYGNIGKIYHLLGDYPRTLEFYAEYLKIASEIGDRLAMSIGIGNMGSVYQDQGCYAEALACHGHNLQIALELGDRVGICQCLWSMADIYLAQGQPELGEHYLERAIAVSQIMDAPWEHLDGLFSKADWLAQQQRYREAQSVNDEVLRIASEVEHADYLFKARVLGLQLAVALGATQRQAACSQLAQLLKEPLTEEQQAAIHYAIWRQNQAQEQRQRTSELYAALYRQTPKLVYKQRYEELTGQQLPDPPPLPPLPESVTRSQVDLTALLCQVDELIDEMQGIMA